MRRGSVWLTCHTPRRPWTFMAGLFIGSHILGLVSLKPDCGGRGRVIQLVSGTAIPLATSSTIALLCPVHLSTLEPRTLARQHYAQHSCSPSLSTHFYNRYQQPSTLTPCCNNTLVGIPIKPAVLRSFHPSTLVQCPITLAFLHSQQLILYHYRTQTT